MVSCVDCRNRNFKTYNKKHILCVIDNSYRDALLWRDCPHDAFVSLNNIVADFDRFEINKACNYSA